jgi:HD-like signal output (HDOD) protein
MPVAVENFSLNEVLASTQLPALPASAVEILRIAQDPNAGPADFARPIEADIGLLGQVLRFVNSSYFGFSREITSVTQAITLLGIKPIQNFALWSAVFSLVPNPKFGSFDLKKLWQDSLRRGIFSRELGKARKLGNSEELFAASLLQDIAIPILLKAMPEVYEELIKERNEQNRRLSEIEHHRFGWNHAQAAAALCRNWRLPESFAELIERHPEPVELLNGPQPRYDAACVAVAAMLPSCSDAIWVEQHQFFNYLAQLMNGVSVDFAAMFNRVDSQCVDFAPLLKLAPPERTLSAWFAAAAR